jgi:hypothetical protein
MSMFRMSRFAYSLLRAMIAPDLQAKVLASNLEARSESNRRPLSVDEIMCIGLRILGGAPYIDAVWGFDVSVSAVFHTFVRFVFAGIKSNAGPIWFPSSPSALQAASNLMDKVGTRHHQFYGCVGAIDGVAICIR